MRVLVLVPHEPTLDPRIHYTAQSLAREHHVTVIAIVQESEIRPEANRPAVMSYETIRLPYEKRGAILACYAFFRLWLSGDRRRGRLSTLLIALNAFVLLASAGVLVGAVLITAALLELAVLPWTLVRGGRPWLLPRLQGAAKAGVPARVPTGRFESVTKGLRVTLSVLRFTFSTNALLGRHVGQAGVSADVVYCHDLYTLQTGVALRRRWGAQLVYDSHEYYPYQYQFWCYAPVIRAYESVLVRAVDRYITVSPQLAAELSRVYGLEALHVLPNVEPRPIPRPRCLETEMTRLAGGRLKLLYQGTFAEGRGLEEVISAWQRVDGTKVALFLRGPGNPSLARLERLAEEAGLLGKSIFLLPAVLERDLIAAAQEADVGLIPYKTDRLSYRFACPNKLSQYLHAGLAILSNRIAFVEQVVHEGNLGLCYDVKSVGSFLTAVQSLANDRRAVEEFKKNGVAYAEREYNWERFEGVLLSLVAKAQPERL